MRIFLVTLAVSTVAGVALWQFGLAHRIWPSHPFLATVVVAAGSGIAAQLAASHDPVTARIMHEPGFRVIGISTRTANAIEISGRGVIGKQWDRFMKEGLLGKIPDRVDANILALYTDYESDHSGAYTFILGAKVMLGRERASRNGDQRSSTRQIRCLHLRAGSGVKSRPGILAAHQFLAEVRAGRRPDISG